VIFDEVALGQAIDAGIRNIVDGNRLACIGADLECLATEGAIQQFGAVEFSLIRFRP
jgi:hypothetical protein